MSQATCFVVQGFGKKTDYTDGRVLDLEILGRDEAGDAGDDVRGSDGRNGTRGKVGVDAEAEHVVRPRREAVGLTTLI